MFFLFSFGTNSDKTQTKTKKQQHPFYTCVVYRLGDLRELNAQKD